MANYRDDLAQRRSMASRLTKLSDAITDTLPPMVFARMELEKKLGADHDTVMGFNDIAVDLAAVKLALKDTVAYLGAKSKPPREEREAILARLDEARGNWLRASERFDEIEGQAPGNLLAKSKEAQGDPSTSGSEALIALLAKFLTQIDPKEPWPAITEADTKEHVHNNTLFAYYEKRLSKAGDKLARIGDKLPEALQDAEELIGSQKDKGYIERPGRP